MYNLATNCRHKLFELLWGQDFLNSKIKFNVVQFAKPIKKWHQHKPSTCVSRQAVCWLWLSILCSAELSLTCSSTAFCWWAEASSCSWDSRAVDKAKSSARRTWKRHRRTGGGVRGGGCSSVYSKVKPRPHRDSVVTVSLCCLGFTVTAWVSGYWC